MRVLIGNNDKRGIVPMRIAHYTSTCPFHALVISTGLNMHPRRFPGSRPNFFVGTDIAFLCVLAGVDFEPSIWSMVPPCFRQGESMP